MKTSTALHVLNPNHNSFDDKYELVSTVGRGRGSVVYKAFRITENYDTQDAENLPIALKILTDTEKHPQEALKRIQKEARALVALNHPNIIKSYNYVARADSCYLSMEYAEHGDLAKVLSSSKNKVSTKTALNITKAILAGVQHIHANNIIHRDLKLENILVTKDLKIKITDFSAALLEGEKPDLSLTSRVIGTLEYVAPECLRGRAYSPLSDLYSIGIVLHKLLTGVFPFECDSIHQSIMLKESGILKPLDPDVKKFYPGTSKILSKLLAPLPENRFQSAKDALIAIEEVIDGKYHSSSRINGFINPAEVNLPPASKREKRTSLKLNLFLSSLLLILLVLNYTTEGSSSQIHQHPNVDLGIELAIQLAKNPATGVLENLFTKNHHYTFSVLPYDANQVLFNLGIKSWKTVLIDINPLKKGEPIIIEGKGIKLILRVQSISRTGEYQGDFENQISGTRGNWHLKI